MVSRAFHDAHVLGLDINYAPNAAGDAYEVWFRDDDVQVRRECTHTHTDRPTPLAFCPLISPTVNVPLVSCVLHPRAWWT